MAQKVYRSKAQSVDRVLENVNGTAAHIKRLWEDVLRPQFTTADQSADTALALVEQVERAIEVYDNASVRPGLTEAAQAELNDPTYDVIAEATAFRNAAVSVRDWMVTAFNAEIKPVYLTLSPTAERVIATITVAQLAELVARMDALTATVTFIDD